MIEATKRARKAGTAFAACALALSGVSAAHAGVAPPPRPAATCQPVGALSQPFARFADTSWYGLMPGGTFDGKDSAGWLLTPGARVLAGTEPFLAPGPKGGHLLSLVDGSAAVSPPVCVDETYPTLRIFAANDGSPASTLRVDALFENATGYQAVTVAELRGTSSWAPSDIVPYYQRLASMLTRTGTTAVAFRFMPQGGDWRIDDTFVDPFRPR